MNAAAEFRVLLGVVATIGVVGAVSGIADHITAVGLAAAALVWLAALVIRREVRIRARLADPRTRPAPRRPAAALCSRVGPGEHTPAPPAPTHQRAAARAKSTDPIPDRTGGAR